MTDNNLPSHIVFSLAAEEQARKLAAFASLRNDPLKAAYLRWVADQLAQALQAPIL